MPRRARRLRTVHELLDFTSGRMSAILGHAPPEIVATVREQVAHLDHLHRSLRLYTCCHVTRAFRRGLRLLDARKCGLPFLSLSDTVIK